MNFQLPTPNPQDGLTTKGTKRSKNTKNAFGSSRFVFVAFFVVNVVFAVHAQQQVLDHVVARVGTSSITQTDVDAAVTFGVVEQKDAEGRDPVKQLIDRRLMLAEVNRFPPPEPAEAQIKTLMESMRATAGANAAAVM